MNLKYYICLLALLICVLPVSAQETATVISVSVETDDGDGQSAPVASIVGRLRQATSGVSVDAPELLLQRALKNVDDATGSTDEQMPAVDEDDGDGEKTRQVRGKMVGYRVQVFADNNVKSAKTEARQRERAISQSFPDYGTYVSYASPFWRLRVGDFRSQYEAEKAAAEIKKQFPRYAREVRVVRDRVNVR